MATHRRTSTVVVLDGIGYDRVDVYRDRDGRVFVTAYAPDGSFIATRADSSPELADMAVSAGAYIPRDRITPPAPGDVGGRLSDPVDTSFALRLKSALRGEDLVLDPA